MKILFIGKRFNSGKDSVKENFGRFMRLADELSKQGHRAEMIAVDYQKKERFDTKIHKIAIEVRPVSMATAISFIRFLRKKICTGNYDAIVTGTDPLFGVLALWTAGTIPIIYDIQDDYELMYASYKLPWVKQLEHRCIKKAALVVIGSPQLDKRFAHLTKKRVVIANGMDPKLCKPIRQSVAKKKFQFPNKKIVMYAGRYWWEIKKGIDTAIKTAGKLPNTHFVFIGDGNTKRIKQAKQEGVKNLTAFESVSYQQLMEMLSAADVLLIVYPKSYGNLGYVSYKVAEFMGFNKPIVCSDVGQFGKILSYPHLMYKDGSTTDLREKILTALKMKKADYSKQVKPFTWEHLGKQLNKQILKTIKAKK